MTDIDPQLPDFAPESYDLAATFAAWLQDAPAAAKYRMDHVGGITVARDISSFTAVRVDGVEFTVAISAKLIEVPDVTHLFDVDVRPAAPGPEWQWPDGEPHIPGTVCDVQPNGQCLTHGRPVRCAECKCTGGQWIDGQHFHIEYTGPPCKTEGCGKPTVYYEVGAPGYGSGRRCEVGHDEVLSPHGELTIADVI